MLALLLGAAVPGLGSTSLPRLPFFPDTLTTSKIYLSCPPCVCILPEGKAFLISLLPSGSVGEAVSLKVTKCRGWRDGSVVKRS